MNKKRLSLYLDNICNLKCSYCNVDYSKKRTFSDQDLLDWFEKNKDMIDMKNIKLCGGEPTLIYKDLFPFLDKFNYIFMISNFYDKGLLEKWIDFFNKRLEVVVSLHDEVIETQFENINKFIDNIIGFNLVISYKNIKDSYKYIERIFKLNQDININLLPELPYNMDEKEIDYGILKKELNKLLFLFKKENKLHLLSNMSIVKNVKDNVMECDFKRKVSIFLDGKISPCVCNSPFFISFKESDKNNIKNSKYEDCKKCRKCTLYTCNDGYINNSLNYEEFCFISKEIYDFCLKEMNNNGR